MRHSERDKYRSRIESLISTYQQSDETSFAPEFSAHNAKYVAVLVSGYMEQAIKEIVFEYISTRTENTVVSYLENTWPRSRNMNTIEIRKVLEKFSGAYGENFDSWLEDDESRKTDINTIVSWRNNIAHGHESRTNNVTIVSVKSKFSTIKALVSFIENTLSNKKS